MDSTRDFYSKPSYVGGASFPVYSGSRRQVGGRIFGSSSSPHTQVPMNKNNLKGVEKPKHKSDLQILKDHLGYGHIPFEYFWE